MRSVLERVRKENETKTKKTASSKGGLRLPVPLADERIFICGRG